MRPLKPVSNIPKNRPFWVVHGGRNSSPDRILVMEKDFFQIPLTNMKTIVAQHRLRNSIEMAHFGPQNVVTSNRCQVRLKNRPLRVVGGRRGSGPGKILANP